MLPFSRFPWKVVRNASFPASSSCALVASPVLFSARRLLQASSQPLLSLYRQTDRLHLGQRPGRSRAFSFRSSSPRTSAAPSRSTTNCPRTSRCIGSLPGPHGSLTVDIANHSAYRRPAVLRLLRTLRPATRRLRAIRMLRAGKESSVVVEQACELRRSVSKPYGPRRANWPSARQAAVRLRSDASSTPPSPRPLYPPDPVRGKNDRASHRPRRHFY